MAIIKCPNCGKQISGRSEKCPFCDTVLNAHKEIASQMPILTEALKSTIKKNAMISVGAAVITLVVYSIVDYVINKFFYFELCQWSGLFPAPIERYAEYTIGDSMRVYFIIVIISLIIEMLCFCVIPLFFRVSPSIVHAAGSVLLIIYSALLIFGKESYDRWYEEYFVKPPYDNHPWPNECLLIAFWSIPLLQGVLFLLMHEKKRKRTIFVASVGSVCYLMLSVEVGRWSAGAFRGYIFDRSMRAVTPYYNTYWELMCKLSYIMARLFVGIPILIFAICLILSAKRTARAGNADS